MTLLEDTPQRGPLAPDDIHLGDAVSPAELTHVHLPKLADAGYIEWDRDAHTVVKGPRFDEIRPLMTAIAPLIDDHAAQADD